MSKQSEAKESQKWQKKPPCCEQCKHFTFNKKIVYGNYSVDKDLRCSIGTFKTGKMSWCLKFEQKD